MSFFCDISLPMQYEGRQKTVTMLVYVHARTSMAIIVLTSSVKSETGVTTRLRLV